MIPHSYLTRIADTQDVDAKTVERDYILTHVLAAISRQPGNRGMVFKGGTALRLCYFEGYRYSADLDFSLQAGRFNETFEQRMPQWKSRWESEMSEHLAGEPEPFKTVERSVRRALRSKLRSN